MSDNLNNILLVSLQEQLVNMSKAQAEHHAQNQKAIGEVSTNVECLRKELFEPGGRVSNIEAKMKSQDNRHWIVSAIVVPLTLAIRHGLVKIGWIA